MSLDFAVRGGGRFGYPGMSEGRGEGGVIFHFLRGGGVDLFWNDPFAKDAKCQKKCQALWNCTYL